MSLESDYISAIQAADEARAQRLADELAKEDEVDAAARAALESDHWRLAKAAVWYAGVGIPVFPIKPNEKRPLLPRAHPEVVEQSTCKGECGRDGHGLYDATLDPVKIREWWSHHPFANIGMPTGRPDTWDVIDVDGQTGVASMWNDQPLGGCLADDYMIHGRVKTPRDGGHHLFIPSAGRGNGTNIYPGVDYRGTGGYVLLPPSRIEGVEYRWLQRSTAIGGEV